MLSRMRWKPQQRTNIRRLGVFWLPPSNGVRNNTWNPGRILIIEQSRHVIRGFRTACLFVERGAPHLNEIIQRGSPANAPGKPIPLAVGDFQAVMLAGAVGAAAEMYQLLRLVAAKIGVQVHLFCPGYHICRDIWHKKPPFHSHGLALMEGRLCKGGYEKGAVYAALLNDMFDFYLYRASR